MSARITSERAADLARMGAADGAKGLDYGSSEWSKAELRLYRAAFAKAWRALSDEQRAELVAR